MTAAPRPDRLEPAEEAILDEIASRLALVDRELPRLTAWRPARAETGQLHVVRGRLRSTATQVEGHGWKRRGWADTGGLVAAAALALAVLATVRLAALDSRDAGIRLPDQGASSPSGPAASSSQTTSSPSASPPNKPLPSPARPGTALPTPAPGEVTPADPEVTRTILGRLGARCGVLIEVALPRLEPGVVRKLVATSSLQSYLPDGFGPGWIGSDPNGAARALKGRLLVTERDGTVWIVRGTGPQPSVIQMRATPVGDGTTIWQSADYLWPVDCPAPGTDTKRVITSRGESDWPAGRVVNLRLIWPARIGTDRIAPQ